MQHIPNENDFISILYWYLIFTVEKFMNMHIHRDTYNPDIKMDTGKEMVNYLKNYYYEHE